MKDYNDVAKDTIVYAISLLEILKADQEESGSATEEYSDGVQASIDVLKQIRNEYK